MCSAVRRRMLLNFSTVSPVPERGCGRGRSARSDPDPAVRRAAGAPPRRDPRAVMAASTSERVTRPPAPLPAILDTSSPAPSASLRTRGDATAPPTATGGAGVGADAGAVAAGTGVGEG